MAEQYTQIKLLGEGAFGKCYLCEHKTDGSKSVIKQIDISKMTPQEKKEAYHEAKIMSAFNHPNIIKFRDIYTTTNGKLNIVMDYADGGDLQNKLKQQRNRHLAENEILDIFVQVCLALKHMHDRKVLHRDLKCMNVFLNRDGVVKLGDFGISRVLLHTAEKARSMVGTPYYISPEIVEGRPYGFKSDVWSLGVILYELCALKPPFDGTSLHNLALKIVRGTYTPIPVQYSRELRGLIGQILATDPNRRPSVKDILRSPFVKNRIQGLLSESVRASEFSHTILHKQNLLNPQNNRERPTEQFEPKKPPMEIPPYRRPHSREPKPQVKELPRPQVKELPRPQVRELPRPQVRELPRPQVREIPRLQEVPRPQIRELPKPAVKDLPLRDYSPIPKRVPAACNVPLEEVFKPKQLEEKHKRRGSRDKAVDLIKAQREQREQEEKDREARKLEFERQKEERVRQREEHRVNLRSEIKRMKQQNKKTPEPKALEASPGLPIEQEAPAEPLKKRKKNLKKKKNDFEIQWIGGIADYVNNQDHERLVHELEEAIKEEEAPVEDFEPLTEEEIVDREDELANHEILPMPTDSENKENHKNVNCFVFPHYDTEASPHSGIELLREYLEDQFGTQQLLEVYRVMKEHDTPSFKYDYEAVCEQLQGVIKPEGKQHIKLMHLLIFLEQRT